MTEPAAPPVLEVEDLHTYIATDAGVVRAVDGVSFTVGEREILGLVGESGCGKSVTCRTIAGLMPSPPARSTGHVRLAGVRRPQPAHAVAARSSSACAARTSRWSSRIR